MIFSSFRLVRRLPVPVLVLALILVLALALAGGCVGPSDEKEGGGAPVFLFIASSGVFKVESLGIQVPVPFIRAPGLEDAHYRAGAPDGGFQRLVLLNGSNTFSSLDLSLLFETQLFTANLPGGAGVLQMRLGWAGTRAYLLTDTVLPGVVVDQMDLITGIETPLTVRLDQLGPGRENPVSFDLFDGGNQAYVLYDSGQLAAVNLFLNDRTEGLVADFGPGARDLQVMDNGSVFVGGDAGLFFWEPGQAVRQISDLAGITEIRVRDLSAQTVIVTLDSNDLYEINVANHFLRYYLRPPEPVRSIIPLASTWIKSTRVFPGLVLSAPPYRAGIVNYYHFYIQDPDGPVADITVTIEPQDPGQNVYFSSTGTDTIVFPGKSSVDELDVSFYGGDLPGPVTLHVTAVSGDGQVSQWDTPLVVGP